MEDEDEDEDDACPQISQNWLAESTRISNEATSRKVLRQWIGQSKISLSITDQKIDMMMCKVVLLNDPEPARPKEAQRREIYKATKGVEMGLVFLNKWGWAEMKEASPQRWKRHSLHVWEKTRRQENRQETPLSKSLLGIKNNNLIEVDWVFTGEGAEKRDFIYVAFAYPASIDPYFSMGSPPLFTQFQGLGLRADSSPRWGSLKPGILPLPLSPFPSRHPPRTEDSISLMPLIHPFLSSTSNLPNPSHSHLSPEHLSQPPTWCPCLPFHSLQSTPRPATHCLSPM